MFKTEPDDGKARQFFWLFPLNFYLQRPPRDESLLRREKTSLLSSGKSCLIFEFQNRSNTTCSLEKFRRRLRRPLSYSARTASCEAPRNPIQIAPNLRSLPPNLQIPHGRELLMSKRQLTSFVVFQIVMIPINLVHNLKHLIDFGFFRKIFLPIS